MSKVYDLYCQIGRAFGPSGRENEVRETLIKLAKPYIDEYKIDALGNLICHKKGDGPRIMLASHMDSIGIVATYIEESGFLRFAPVGGLFRGDLINIQVRFSNGVRGVISYEEKTPFKELQMENLFLDIGADSREEAEKMVMPGDFAVFEAPTFEQGDRLCGPYMDNRIGCVALFMAMEKIQKPKNDLYFVFTVQEEVGLRGAQTAAFEIEPEYAIAVDVTDTGDLPEKKSKMAVKLGKGPAVKVMDSSVICSAQVKDALYRAAEALSMPVQREILEAGGTDTGAIQKSRGGVLAGAVSIPARYIHSPSELVSVRDVENCALLLAKTAGEGF